MRGEWTKLRILVTLEKRGRDSRGWVYLVFKCCRTHNFSIPHSSTFPRALIGCWIQVSPCSHTIFLYDYHF